MKNSKLFKNLHKIVKESDRFISRTSKTPLGTDVVSFVCVDKDFNEMDLIRTSGIDACSKVMFHVDSSGEPVRVISRPQKVAIDISFAHGSIDKLYDDVESMGYLKKNSKLYKSVNEEGKDVLLKHYPFFNKIDESKIEYISTFKRAKCISTYLEPLDDSFGLVVDGNFYDKDAEKLMAFISKEVELKNKILDTVLRGFTVDFLVDEHVYISSVMNNDYGYQVEYSELEGVNEFSEYLIEIGCFDCKDGWIEVIRASEDSLGYIIGMGTYRLRINSSIYNMIKSRDNIIDVVINDECEKIRKFLTKSCEFEMNRIQSIYSNKLDVDYRLLNGLYDAYSMLTETEFKTRCMTSLIRHSDRAVYLDILNALHKKGAFDIELVFMMLKKYYRENKSLINEC